MEVFKRDDGGRSTPYLDTKAKVLEAQELNREFGQISLTIDGDYGPQTARSFADFQGMYTYKAANGSLLAVDGDFGPLTKRSMLECVANGNQVSPNFNAEEFLCHCTMPWLDMARQTITEAEEVRAFKGGNPLVVVSAHRNDHHEAAIGGAFGGHVCKSRSWATDSPGCDTSAIDIVSSDVQLTLWEARQVIGIKGGVGVVETTGFVRHWDQGPYRNWTYRS